VQIVSQSGRSRLINSAHIVKLVPDRRSELGETGRRARLRIPPTVGLAQNSSAIGKSILTLDPFFSSPWRGARMLQNEGEVEVARIRQTPLNGDSMSQGGVR
jgi:hypothetical protein